MPAQVVAAVGKYNPKSEPHTLLQGPAVLAHSNERIPETHADVVQPPTLTLNACTRLA